MIALPNGEYGLLFLPIENIGETINGDVENVLFLSPFWARSAMAASCFSRSVQKEWYIRKRNI
jgi:hypothetical protein